MAISKRPLSCGTRGIENVSGLDQTLRTTEVVSVQEQLLFPCAWQQSCVSLEGKAWESRASHSFERPSIAFIC